jgi:hypothetical protein
MNEQPKMFENLSDSALFENIVICFTLLEECYLKEIEDVLLDLQNEFLYRHSLKNEFTVSSERFGTLTFSSKN